MVTVIGWLVIYAIGFTLVIMAEKEQNKQEGKP